MNPPHAFVVACVVLPVATLAATGVSRPPSLRASEPLSLSKPSRLWAFEALRLDRRQSVTREQLFEQMMAEPPKAPVSAEEGRAVFDKLCAPCHKFGGIGKDVGPDLTTMTSRLKKKDILESILWPSKTISDQFEMALIQTKAGDVISGMVQRENAQAVFMVTAQAPDKPIRVLKAQIQERKKSSVSMMPEALVDGLGVGPVGSLMAFLLGRPPR